MTAAQEHVHAAFKVARKHLYDQYKAERMAELRDRGYRKYDGRGFHSISLEVGRMYALTELCPELSDGFDVQQIRAEAREDATAEWREETFAEYLPAVDAA